MNYRQPFDGSYPITQGYGDTDTSAFHTGIDYACPTGTPILASEAGTVMFAGWDNTGLLGSFRQKAVYSSFQFLLFKKKTVAGQRNKNPTLSVFRLIAILSPKTAAATDLVTIFRRSARH